MDAPREAQADTGQRKHGIGLPGLIALVNSSTKGSGDFALTTDN